jgi:ABC-type molybdate transport system substrate-binding protein
MKALKLVGFAGAPTAPPGRSVYAMLLNDGKADLFLTYCTNAMDAQRENAALQMVRLPDELSVAADYGLTVMTPARAAAYQFAMFILAAEAQGVLAKYGFASPGLPQ